MLAALLSGCLRPADPSSFVAVITNEKSQISPEACEGGLRAVVNIADVELVNQIVATEKMITVTTLGLPKGSNVVYQGSPVFAKAWCFESTGEELGYAEIQGTLGS